MSKLKAVQIRASLARLPEWKRTGKIIHRTFVFKDFVGSIRFVNRAAKIAEALWHHPDIQISWNKVTLNLTSHDVGGLTVRDFKAARKFDALV